MTIPDYARVYRKPYRATITGPTGNVPVNISCTADGYLKFTLGKGLNKRTHHSEFLLTAEELQYLSTKQNVLVKPPPDWVEFATRLQRLSEACIAAAKNAICLAGWHYGGLRGNKRHFWRGQISALQAMSRTNPQLMAEGFAILHPQGLDLQALKLPAVPTPVAAVVPVPQ